MTPARAMPPTSRTSLELWVDRLGFGFFRYVDFSLTTLFITAIVLGVARLAFLASLALWHRLKAPRREPPMVDPEAGHYEPPVLIPCFNEEKVIVASVARILHSNWRPARCWCWTTGPATLPRRGSARRSATSRGCG